MSRIRWSLSKAEQIESRAWVMRLRAGGADLEEPAPTERDSPRLSVTQLSPRFTSYARNSPHGSVFAIRVSITALAPKVIICNFDLSSLDCDLNPYIVDDPSENRSTEIVYCLADGRSFDRTEVLNHRLDDAGILRNGDRMEGLLLAQAFESIPESFATGSILRFTLSIRDQFDDVHGTAIEIPVERPAQQARPRSVRRASLFEPDTPTIEVPDKTSGIASTGLRNGGRPKGEDGEHRPGPRRMD